MRSAALLFGCLFVIAAVGCGVQPKPGMSAAEVSVVAKPKSGAPKKFVHVPVYDAAPVAAGATGQFEQVDYDNLSDIIVWLEPEPASATANTEPVSPKSIPINVDKPSTEVIAASVGQQVTLLNQSPGTVSLYSVTDGNEFDTGPIAPGATASFTVQSPGAIEILADPSKPPVAQLYAAPSAHVARVESGHSVTFNNVPPGAYQAVSWHPRLPGGSTPVILTPDNLARCTLTVGVNNLPGASSTASTTK